MSRYILTLHVEGPTPYTDLTVSGFPTRRIATEIGEGFAQFLRTRYGSNATVTALVDRTDDRHIIDLRADGWTIMHPLACRPRLFECQVTRAAERELTNPPDEPGRYVCGLDHQGEFLIREAAE